MTEPLAQHPNLLSPVALGDFFSTSNHNGLPCSPAGDMFNCFWSTGERGFCFCEPVAGQPGFYWVCGTGKP
jgi:hypothetical protein